MKKIISSLLLVLFLVNVSFAQKSKNKEDSPPLIDPITNCHLRYYYYPNLEAYYDTEKKIYYYKEDSQWTNAEEIPDGYRGYSLYNKIYVYITDYDDEIITQFIDIHRKKHPYTKKGKINMMGVTTK